MSALRLIPALVLLLLLATGCPKGAKSPGGPGYDKDRHAAAVLELGIVAMNTGNYATALTSLQEAEKMDPKNAVTKQYMGRTYYRMKEYEKAQANYEAALALNPALTDVHNDLGLLFIDLKEYAKAREQFTICINDLTYKDSSLARFNLALVEEAEGNTAAASEIYQRLIASGEQSSVPYFRLAYLAFKEGDYTHAADLLNAAVRLQPDNAEAYFLLGESYEKMGMKDEAAEAYGRAVGIDPQSLRGIEAQRRVREIMKDYKP
ncbi:MAG: tetratricopeptide repeat protein [Deltaproteobacteria bacterium]|jgi:Tfp pilus assembly protein PilF|nr:tetratricopeptide repeat protein [Deltaproteobacteria bacterium]